MAKRTELEQQERQIVADLYHKLRAIAGVVGSHDVEPDDLVQEALVRTLARHNLTDLDNPLAFLRKTIVNVASNRRRSLGRKRRAYARLNPAEGEVPSYPSDVESILDLKPKQRAVLYLVYVEHMPYAEAAAELGMSPDAARQTARRAKRKARLNLEVEHG